MEVFYDYVKATYFYFYFTTHKKDLYCDSDKACGCSTKKENKKDENIHKKEIKIKTKHSPLYKIHHSPKHRK